MWNNIQSVEEGNHKRFILSTKVRTKEDIRSQVDKLLNFLALMEAYPGIFDVGYEEIFYKVPIFVLES